MLLKADVISIYAPLAASLSAIVALVTVLIARRRMRPDMSTPVEGISKQDQKTAESPSQPVEKRSVGEASGPQMKEPERGELHRKMRLAAEIFGRYGDEIRAIIAHNVKDRSKADDVYQDFFISLVNQPVPPHVKDIEAYFYRAITRDVIDLSRRAGTHRENIRKYAESRDYTLIRDDLRDLLVTTDEAQKVFQLVAQRIPYRKAVVVAQRYGQRYGSSEVPEKSHIDKRTVYRYLSIARKKMREFWHEEPPHE